MIENTRAADRQAPDSSPRQRAYQAISTLGLYFFYGIEL